MLCSITTFILLSACKSSLMPLLFRNHYMTDKYLYFKTIFSGYGTSMCCSRIRVTLSGVVKDKQGGFAGNYQKASGLINGRSYWNQMDGGNALWWNNIFNVWEIGNSSELGSNSDNSIHPVQDSACPTSDNLFKYLNGKEWSLAPRH